MFDVPIQAAIGGRIVARETVKARQQGSPVAGQVLRRRHHPQAQAAREAERGQEADEEHRAGRGAPGGLHLRLTARGRLRRPLCGCWDRAGRERRPPWSGARTGAGLWHSVNLSARPINDTARRPSPTCRRPRRRRASRPARRHFGGGRQPVHRHRRARRLLPRGQLTGGAGVVGHGALRDGLPLRAPARVTWSSRTPAPGAYRPTRAIASLSTT